MRKLLQRFENRIDLPIEIDEMGIQDKIVFSDENLDTGVLRGVFYQWREHGGVYGEPISTTLILYPKAESLPWQRLICAKELVHVCDKQIIKTQTPEMIEKLAEKIIGGFQDHFEGPADLMATMDKLAQYQGLNFLFPLAARKLAREKIAAEEQTIEQIADWAAIPIEQAQYSIPEAWDTLSELILRIGNGGHPEEE